ncbi:MAG: hypothetical protein Q4D50_09820 [Eubacteriales bacterium]|nr:hypothetical protein [Eubacteriales bacterium]
MKRRFQTAFFVLVTVLLLTACGKVSETEEAISRIGEVTMESGQRIAYAEELYNALPAAKQTRVDNAGILRAARQKYDDLCGMVEEAIGAIDAIGQVTADSGPRIQAARTACASAEEAGLGSYITNKSTLRKAEESYGAILLQQAQELLDGRNYQQAYELFGKLRQEYPGSSVASAAEQGQAEALICTAEQMFNSGDLEGAVSVLDTIDKHFGSSERTQSLTEKLEKRLSSQRPTTGRKFKDGVGWGYGQFTVSAGSTDAYVKLENIADPTKYTLFYVRAGEQATINVKDGSYRVKYACGKYWFGQDRMFGEKTAFTMAEDTMDFSTTREGSYIYYSDVSITLYAVLGGDLETTEIDPEDF